MFKHDSLTSGDFCLVSAAAVLLLSALLAGILMGGMSLPCAAGALAAACAILTSVPEVPREEDRVRPAVWCQTVAALMPVPLACGAGEAALPALYTFAVVVPLAWIRVRSVLRRTADGAFLSASAPGWETVSSLSKQVFTLFPVLLLSVSWSGLLLGGAAGRALLWGSVAALGLLLVVTALRGITQQPQPVQPAVPPEPAADDRSGEAGTMRPRPAAGLEAGHRILFDKVGRYMDESKPYLDETFSLGDLSKALLTNKSYMSKVINGGSGMNFSQFVNHYRIRYSMELYRLDPCLKVTELAMMSGFRNGVTFNLAFKLFVGLPPSEWCRQCRERPPVPDREKINRNEPCCQDLC